MVFEGEIKTFLPTALCEEIGNFALQGNVVTFKTSTSMFEKRFFLIKFRFQNGALSPELLQMSHMRLEILFLGLHDNRSIGMKNERAK